MAGGLAAAATWADGPRAEVQVGPPQVRVQLPAPSPAPLDGRLLVIFAKDGTRGEPRHQVSDGPAGQQIFGMDVENWTGAPIALDASVDGFPLARIADVPAGTYTVAFTCGDDDPTDDDTLTFIQPQNATVQPNLITIVDFIAPSGES